MTFFQEGTARDAQAVTPSDSADLTGPCNALWVGGSGNVSVVTAAGTTVTLANVLGLVPLRCRRVRSTGTTATNIVALY